MTYSPSLSSGFEFTKNRSNFISPQSGMCSFCTEECLGTCDIGLSAVLGAQTVYPTTTGTNQIASEKDYPLDYSCFNINGRVFGAIGANETYEEATIYNVKLEREYGSLNKVKMAIPIILPALIKLNWKDYFGGAAMAGVTCVVGENARNKDENLVIENGKIKEFPFIGQVLDSFNMYYRGYGQIVVQCNVEDDMLGVPEIAISKYGAKAIELKFGQSAKGTQPAIKLKNLEAAMKAHNSGEIVYPNPADKDVQKSYDDGVCPNFYSYSRLPLWNEDFLHKRIRELREMGAQNIYFKMAGYDKVDIERVLRIASNERVDMITFDGAGGGSGYSPCKMMNEWSLPTVCLEDTVVKIIKKMKAEEIEIPAITITGGFSSEDQVFKALAYGENNITSIGLCRASMAAAMTSKNVGNLIINCKVPERYKKYGSSIQEIFGDLPDLRAIYGKDANKFSTGAIGVFSYLNKIAFGVKHFSALNRKFDIKYLDKSDLIPLTQDAVNLMNA
ncbi:FMN-binding glutamate synthase family protein [Sedimentibacter sp. zth1]|uniref:glutamate synthase-related protein n=1 Tax=Sedimentibacter sp. zth1 TaxID=2816908 RepID=UPI001A9330D6|nr:glutamate synthase-related protein [Sedimentibacter sp. zth1]QSX06909.1 FMN-binding glutamate synthase family protein [Sedimentibacter sp. zth1]